MNIDFAERKEKDKQSLSESERKAFEQAVSDRAEKIVQDYLRAVAEMGGEEVHRVMLREFSGGKSDYPLFEKLVFESFRGNEANTTNSFVEEVTTQVAEKIRKIFDI